MKKVIFGINITDNKKNDQTDEQALVTKRLEGWQQHELERTREESNAIQKKITLPTALVITKFTSFFFTIVIGCGIISSIIKGNTFAQTYDNAPVLIYIFPIALIGWLTLYFYEKKIRKNVEDSPELEKMEKGVEEVIKQSVEEFDIPEDAVEMDFLAFRYKIKKDEVTIVSSGMFTYLNIVMNTFVKDDKLCLANLEEMVEIDLKDFISIDRRDKNAMIPSWNKETQYNKEPYKKFKLKQNQMGMLFTKPYYVVDFCINGQSYMLYVPVYEIAAFIKMTGIEYRDEYTS